MPNWAAWRWCETMARICAYSRRRSLASVLARWPHDRRYRRCEHLRRLFGAIAFHVPSRRLRALHAAVARAHVATALPYASNTAPNVRGLRANAASRGPEQGRGAARLACAAPHVSSAVDREACEHQASAASASCGRMRATCDGSGATSRASPSRTCERTCNLSDVVGCSRGASAAARALSRHARHRNPRVGGEAESTSNEAGRSPAATGAHGAAIAATRGRTTTSRHRRLE